MEIIERLKWISTQPGFAFWVALVGENNICELSRTSGFQIDVQNQTITTFIPQSMFTMLEPTLKPNAKLSLLMASIRDFESYQVKGNYLNYSESSTEQVNFYLDNVMKTKEEITALGLDGAGIMGYLLKTPSIAVTMKCEEIYEQTPKPGTGHLIPNMP